MKEEDLATMKTMGKSLCVDSMKCYIFLKKSWETILCRIKGMTMFTTKCSMIPLIYFFFPPALREEEQTRGGKKEKEKQKEKTENKK